MSNPHIGSTLESFLKEEGIYETAMFKARVTALEGALQESAGMPPDPPDVVDVARDYLARVATGEGVDVIVKDLADEVDRLRAVVGALHRELGME